ncbi:MAG: SCO family protein [Spirochaetota bacterium]
MKHFFAFICLSIAVSVSAYDPGQKPVRNETPKQLQDVGIFENPGVSLDLQAPFRDQNGQDVTLAKYFTSSKPVLLALIYYKCPNLCNFQLNGLTKALKEMKWTVGKEFSLVAISIDAKETPEIASKKRDAYLKEYARVEADKGWHFLTGPEESIHKISAQVGFRFKWNEETEQWAHSAATYVMTPDGKLSRYLYGIGYEAKTLRLSLVEASQGKIGDIVDRFVLFCFQFNPEKNQYTLYAYNLMRVAASITVLFLGIFLFTYWNNQNKKEPQGA